MLKRMFLILSNRPKMEAIIILIIEEGQVEETFSLEEDMEEIVGEIEKIGITGFESIKNVFNVYVNMILNLLIFLL